MKDERYWPVLGAWLKDTAEAPPDPRQTARRVAERLPETTQVRRRWWLPSPRRASSPPSIGDPITRQPDPIPAADGRTTTIAGRTQIMFSPAKAITATALALGIGGVLLIAQPFQQQSVIVPGAAMDDPAMAPSFFTVVTDDWVLNASSVTERGDDDVVRGTGESNTFSWEANDPRITGTATMIVNETDYRESAILAPTGDLGSVRTGLLRIVNDGGSWEGPITHVVLTNQGAERNSIAGWLTGTDSYEGLRAYVVSEFEDGTFWGHITAESPPPPPEGPSE